MGFARGLEAGMAFGKGIRKRIARYRADNELEDWEENEGRAEGFSPEDASAVERYDAYNADIAAQDAKEFGVDTKHQQYQYGNDPTALMKRNEEEYENLRRLKRARLYEDHGLDEEARGIYDNIRADRDYMLRSRDVDSQIATRAAGVDHNNASLDVNARNVDSQIADRTARRAHEGEVLAQANRHFNQTHSLNAANVGSQIADRTARRAHEAEVLDQANRHFNQTLSADERRHYDAMRLNYDQLAQNDYWKGNAYTLEAARFANLQQQQGREFAHREAMDRFTVAMQTDEHLQKMRQFRAEEIQRHAEYAFKMGDPKALAAVYSNVRNGHSVAYQKGEDGMHRFVDNFGNVVGEGEDSGALMAKMFKMFNPKAAADLAQSEMYAMYMKSTADKNNAETARMEKQGVYMDGDVMYGNSKLLDGFVGVPDEDGVYRDVTNGLTPREFGMEMLRTGGKRGGLGKRPVWQTPDYKRHMARGRAELDRMNAAAREREREEEAQVLGVGPYAMPRFNR